MKTLVASKKTVNRKDIVNFKHQTLLFAFSILMHAAATSVHTEYPLLGWLLAILEVAGWICILMTWVIALVKTIQYGVPKLWTKIWAYVRIKKATHLASVEQLKHLQNNIQRLQLALHGLTPEMEQARRAHFQMLSEVVPPPVLPAQNAVLWAEFESLTRFLQRFGFPYLESVRLQQKDFEFAREWGRTLEARLQQAQQNYAYQQKSMEWVLNAVNKQFEALGYEYLQAQDHRGYQRLQGAHKLLSKMARESHHPEEVTGYLTALMQDMEMLRKQLEQTAV